MSSSSSSLSLSSFSSSSSSSTEIRSSSSSSSSRSSYLDYHDNKTLPFIYEVEDISPVWCMATYGEYVFAGTGPEGILLRSKDRFIWEKLTSVNDINISSLYVFNGNLYIGTSPNGMIYVMNLATGEMTLSQEIGNVVYGFIDYKNKIYAAGGIPNQIWVYNEFKNRWDSIYYPHSTIITKMLKYNGKIYVFSNSENIISFDGTYWVLESSLPENISSLRRVSTEPYSHTKNDFIERKNIKKVSLDTFEAEDIYDIFPINYAKGIKSAAVDGITLAIGSSNYAKVYNYYNSTFTPIFETESLNTVYYILNLDVGVNLASIDNKLYLVHSGNLSSEVLTEEITTTTTSTTTITPPAVRLIYPSGGETILLGETITIQWASNRSVNDAVKIDLYQGTELNTIINPSTSNDGSYEWQVPNNIIPGIDYKIILTWLTSSNADPNNIAVSGDFNILVTPLPTTTTTTTMINPLVPKTNESRGIPLLDLANGEYITYMLKDVAKGGILFSTSKGRILFCSMAVVNAYMTGERNVYAEVKDGFGNVSDTAWTNIFYGLYNKIAEVNAQKEIVKYKYVVQPTAILNDRITGIFLSPILSVKENLNAWKQLIWRENKPEDTEIIICIRSSDSIDSLKLLPWDFCFVSRDSDRAYGSTGYITRDLKDYQINGKYIQFKVTMTTNATNITPSLVDLSLTYSTAFASYFFTTKFSLQNQSDLKSGLITANMTEPQNTEIKFGIAGTNTSDWNDYTVVDPNKLFSLNNLERLKVGIKMIAYDDNIPEVAEFSLLTGALKDNAINNT